MSWRWTHGRFFRVGTWVLAAFLFLTAGCATMPDPSDPEAVAEYTKVNDPAEPTNRAIFEINRGLDGALLKPLAKFYRDVTPQYFQDRINDLLNNLRSPVIFFNDLLQGELKRALGTAVRFMVNSGVSQFVEFGPSRVLASLIKRIDRDVEAVTLSDNASMQKLSAGLK